MRHSKNQLEEQSYVLALLGNGLASGGSLIVRNPAIAGGTMAFLVAFLYVSANALWYQPHFHDGAFFTTRVTFAEKAMQQEERKAPAPQPRPARSNETKEPDRSETTGAVPQEGDAAAKTGESSVSRVQTVLADLDLYDGAVDGLLGPQTHEAIKDYQRIVGLDTTGAIDGALLRQLGLRKAERAEVPTPTPRPESADDSVSDVIQTASTESVAPTSSQTEADDTVKRVQAGLRAFGNDGIEIDGVAGEDTSAAIREFQSLFGLPVTGEPDQTLLAKMREIGLTN